MHDGVEPLLKVDPLTEAVGANEHSARCFAKLPYPLLPIVGCKLACDSGYCHVFRKTRAQLLCHVTRGRDETAEHNGVEAIMEETPDQFDTLLKLQVTLASERVCLAGHLL